MKPCRVALAQIVRGASSKEAGRMLGISPRTVEFHRANVMRKLGARIDIEDAHHASIHGPARLHGAETSISDLRAGASLILAALAADGGSLIHGAHHVHRGYENIDRKFQQLGARISRTADAA